MEILKDLEEKCSWIYCLRSKRSLVSRTIYWATRGRFRIQQRAENGSRAKSTRGKWGESKKDELGGWWDFSLHTSQLDGTSQK